MEIDSLLLPSREAMAVGRLSKVFEVLQSHFEVKDKMGFEIIFAVAAAHYVPGEMLWVRVYGGSRSGKTEILTAILKHPDAVPMEIITPASIRGGLKGGHKLLKRIKDKLVITKDLASILTSKKEARNEVFGLLRGVKDGSLVSDFGTEDGFINQEAAFDWILGTTQAFAQYRQMEDLLGARFIDLRWLGGDREEAALRAAENNPVLGQIRDEIAKAVCDLLDKVKSRQKLDSVGMPSNLRQIAQWADLTALLRSPIARSYQHRVKYIPMPEVGTDLAQGFTRIAQGLQLLGINDPQPYLVRLCWDSIPDIRAKVIEGLLRGIRDTQSLSNELNVPWSTINLELEDLQLLRVVKRDKQGNTNLWELVPELEPRIAELWASKSKFE